MLHNEPYVRNVELQRFLQIAQSISVCNSDHIKLLNHSQRTAFFAHSAMRVQSEIQNYHSPSTNFLICVYESCGRISRKPDQPVFSLFALASTHNIQRARTRKLVPPGIRIPKNICRPRLRKQRATSAALELLVIIVICYSIVIIMIVFPTVRTQQANDT